MELTPELLDEQEFPVVLRGYDTASVDDFLERVGAGLGVLLDRLDQAGARMAEMEAELAAEGRAAPEHAPTDFQGRVDQVSRALVLAQEAADRATAEAQVEAERLVAEARTTADGLVTRANADVEARISTAEAEVEERAAALRAVRDRELADLAAQQQSVEAEIVRLRHELDEQRRHLQAVAAAARAVLEGPELADRSEPAGEPSEEGQRGEDQRGDDPPGEPADAAAEVTTAADAVEEPLPAEEPRPAAPEQPTELVPTVPPVPDDNGPVPADQSTFWRATEAAERADIEDAGSALFDQDDQQVAPAAPLLRAVEPPDDDPFLAALRGDDDAAARLADRPDDDAPPGLMRRLRGT